MKRPNGFKHFFIVAFDKFLPIFRICAGYVHKFPADVNSRVKPLAPPDRAVVAKPWPTVFKSALHLAPRVYFTAV